MSNVKSSKPKAQRKWHYEKPKHVLRKEFSAHLSKEMRKQFGRRSLELKKGDTVKVMRGDNEGKQGKVSGFRTAKMQVRVEGIIRKKMSGKEVMVPLKASNLLIIAVDEKDQRRFKNRKGRKPEARAQQGKGQENAQGQKIGSEISVKK